MPPPRSCRAAQRAASWGLTLSHGGQAALTRLKALATLQPTCAAQPAALGHATAIVATACSTAEEQSVVAWPASAPVRRLPYNCLQAGWCGAWRLAAWPFPDGTLTQCLLPTQAARREDAKRAQREKASQAEKLKKAEAAAARAAGQAAASAGVAKDGHEVCRILDSSCSADTLQ
jgi:hypothetical protein